MNNRYMKKVLKITNFQGNVSQNNNETSPHSQIDHYLKEKKNVEKREFFYAVCRNINSYRHGGKQYGCFSKN